ncbi:MAG: helix-turn-helix domain-containing protein [Nannocystaceae bacterium]
MAQGDDSTEADCRGRNLSPCSCHNCEEVNVLYRALGALARGLRLESGLTQAEVARRIAKSRSWVNRLEVGRAHRACLNDILKVFNVFDVGALTVLSTCKQMLEK